MNAGHYLCEEDRISRRQVNTIARGSGSGSIFSNYCQTSFLLGTRTCAKLAMNVPSRNCNLPRGVNSLGHVLEPFLWGRLYLPSANLQQVESLQVFLSSTNRIPAEVRNQLAVWHAASDCYANVNMYHLLMGLFAKCGPTSPVFLYSIYRQFPYLLEGLESIVATFSQKSNKCNKKLWFAAVRQIVSGIRMFIGIVQLSLLPFDSDYHLSNLSNTVFDNFV